MSNSNGLLASVAKHLEINEEKLTSIEKVTEIGLRNISDAVKELSGELKYLRGGLISALLEQQIIQQKAGNRMVLITLGTVTSILVSVFVWITGIEPRLSSHSSLFKHETGPSKVD